MTDSRANAGSSPSLADYLAEDSYRFQMRFGRGTFEDFYRATPEHESLVGERREWLRNEESRCLAFTPESGPFLAAAARLGVARGTLPETVLARPAPRELARALGGHWEPDYLLLAREPGTIRLICGCVCFPSSWALEEKIGLDIGSIHEVVPGLNEAIGAQIRVFLERLKPGPSWTRSNWGLSRSPERHQHPVRGLPRLDGTVQAAEVFFRVEEQSLVAVEMASGAAPAILFGIRIKVFPLSEFLGQEAGRRLSVALQTMPEPMARYKGILPARERILELLGATCQ